MQPKIEIDQPSRIKGDGPLEIDGTYQQLTADQGLLTRDCYDVVLIPRITDGEDTNAGTIWLADSDDDVKLVPIGAGGIVVPIGLVGRIRVFGESAGDILYWFASARN